MPGASVTPAMTASPHVDRSDPASHRGGELSTVDDALIARRKGDHLRIAASPQALHHGTNGLERHRLIHRALPERALDEVDLRTRLLGCELRAPLLIGAMTGGTAQAQRINDRLAAAACEHGIGLMLGSGRPLIEHPELARTYVGELRPPLLLANVGAAQLLERDGLAQAQRLTELLSADGLVVHLNPLQEAVQPEGEPMFGGVLERIAALVVQLDPVPVVVKEVGFGIAAADAERLASVGVAAIDVAGAGGTNWALVEGARSLAAAEVASAFASWGISTADAVIGAARADLRGAALIASGGVTDGVAAAICLALGADAVALARTVLLAAQEDRATEALGAMVQQLRIATWLAGAATAADLGPGSLQQEGPAA